MAAEVTGKVTLTGDASGLDKSAKAAKGAMVGLENQVKKTGEAHDKASRAATNHRMSIDAMKAQLFGSVEIIKKSIKIIDMITEAEIKAGGGADVFTQSWISLKKTLSDPAFFQGLKNDLADMMTAMDPFQQMALQLNRGFGDHRRGIGFRKLDDTARKMLRGAEASEARQAANLTAALLGSLKEGERVRQEHLKSERGITKELKEQKEVIDTIAESHRVNELARLQAAREIAANQREETFNALDDQFGEASQSFEALQLQRLEAAKQAAHEAQMARIEAEKQAEEERLAVIERNVAFGQMAADVAVSGILDITDARKDAIRQAKLAGKTDREASQAGKIAAAIALESQLKNLRNMAAMHAIEYTAKGIASQASTYGIPNPQSIGYFTAAGIFAGVAVGSGLGAMAAGNRADSLQGGGGSGNGFGAAEGGGIGGGGGSSRGGSGGGGIDSQIPGSPTPKPKGMWQQQSQGGMVINIQNVYGTPRRDFIRQITEGQRDLGYAEPERGAA
jgi:hypothetical protein